MQKFLHYWVILLFLGSWTSDFEKCLKIGVISNWESVNNSHRSTCTILWHLFAPKNDILYRNIKAIVHLPCHTTVMLGGIFFLKWPDITTASQASLRNRHLSQVYFWPVQWLPQHSQCHPQCRLLWQVLPYFLSTSLVDLQTNQHITSGTTTNGLYSCKLSELKIDLYYHLSNSSHRDFLTETLNSQTTTSQIVTKTTEETVNQFTEFKEPSF